MALSIWLLGPAQVSLDRELVSGLRSGKALALLTYLAVESDRAHRREKLAGMLWPDYTESSARASLRRALADLRQAIGDHRATPPYLHTTRETIQFNRDSDYWLDVEAIAGRTEDLAGLEEVVALYRGSFLEGFSVSDAPSFEEWALLKKEQLKRQLLKVLDHLATTHEQRGEYEQAQRHAWRQVELEPWDEQAHRRLMQLLALGGQRNAALAQYETCRRLLAEELDVEPSAETTHLYEQIRDETLTSSLPSPEHRPRPTHNLPLTLGPFVGREAEMAEIQHYLRDPACRLLTLVGPGGIGKTRLAVESVADWISRLREGELEGVTLVSLTPLQAVEAIVPAIAQAISLPLPPGRDPEQQLLDSLSGKRWLLILDSFEHLPEGAGFVAEILRTTPQVKVLVTSRARLNLHGEHCFPVAGIPFPERITEDVQQARGFAAVNLFLQSAHRVQPGFEPTNVDLAAVSRICRLVQGMPLGILLAVAWLAVLRPAEIADEIGKSLDFLEADWPDVPERQRSLRAIFDRSWNLLTDREREVFQSLSVFSGGFTRAAAHHVSGGSLHELRSLADKSLIQVTPSGRYEIHELLRQYAAEKLHSLPEAATDVSERHCGYYTAALQRWEVDLTGARQSVALVEMEAESGNLSAAWTCAVERGQLERLDRAMEGLEYFCWHSGRYREGEAAFQAAAAAAAAAVDKTADKATCLRVRVRALAWQSNFCRATGQQDAARRLQQQCLTILQDPALVAVDTRLERAILSMTIGAIDWETDYEQGRQWYKESFSLFHDLGHPWGMAWALNAWGTMSMFLGAFQDAKRQLEEGLAIRRALGNQAGVANSLSRLAQIAWLQGRLQEAECLARQGVATSLEAGSRTHLALALLNLGEVLEKVAKFSEAHSTLQQSLALLIDLGHRHYITLAHSDLGSIDLHAGRYQEACEHAQTGLTLAREHGPRFCVGLNLLLLGCLSLAEGTYVIAHQLLQDGVDVYREVGLKLDLSLALAHLVFAAYELGDTRGARQHLFHALETAVEFRAVPPLLWALPAMARLLAGEGENERAVELYALASRHPLVAKSRWFADVAGDQIATVAAALPAERVAVLEQRGRARDLEATAAELLIELQNK